MRKRKKQKENLTYHLNYLRLIDFLPSSFHIADVFQIQTFEFILRPLVDVALSNRELERGANLQVLEVDAQAGDVTSLSEERVECVEGEAHFGEIDTRDARAETSGDQQVGVVDRDELGGAPFGRAYVGERELVPELVGVREKVPAARHARALAQVAFVQECEDLE